MTRPRFLTSLFFLYAAALFGGTAILQAGLFERDGYYHARLAQLLPERGLSRSFPWTQLSTWRDGYCDKEVLFHAAMARRNWSASPGVKSAARMAICITCS